MFKRKASLLFVTMVLLLSGCNLPSSVTPAAETQPVVSDTPEVVQETEPAEQPTQEPVAQGNSSVSGMVFHDECAGSGQASGESIPSGCLNYEGKLIANGVKDPAEIGIAGVWVSLGAGSCPSAGLYKIQSNNQGVFSFPNLPAGTYCITINPSSDEMLNPVSILIPGKWTSPNLFPEVLQYEVELAENQTLEDVFFGWDYQNLPIVQDTPVPEEVECEDQVSFVEHVTYPAGSTVDSNQSFTKTWRIRNDGTCTWDSAYSFEFIQGDKMGGASPALLPQTVNPGGSVDVSVSLMAPGEQGTYQGDWLLKAPSGAYLGFGADGDQPFQVNIIVKPSNLSNLKDILGNPDFQDDFETDTNWSTFSDSNMVFEHKGDTLVMRSLEEISWDTWTWSWPVLKNFYLETEVTTSATCSGRDRYGLIARVKDSDNVYLFGFTCDGKYSIRLWDGEFDVLQDWTSSNYINGGPGQTNFLGVKLDGKKLTIYANGEELATVTDDTLQKGKFGLFFAAPETIGFEAIFEMIRYWELPD